MRTTITLEKDVAARLDRLRRDRPFKELVNEALRTGLDQLEQERTPANVRYSIVPAEGKPRRIDIDNIGDVVAELEGDQYK